MRGKVPLLCQLGLRETKYSAASAGDQMAYAQRKDTEATRALASISTSRALNAMRGSGSAGKLATRVGLGWRGRKGTCGSGRLSGRESMQGEWRWSKAPKVARELS